MAYPTTYPRGATSIPTDPSVTREQIEALYQESLDTNPLARASKAERNADMYLRYRDGETLSSIARRYDLSAPRVRSIIAKIADRLELQAMAAAREAKRRTLHGS
jgi:DNA-directed RNA polymerase sigma subunit (sigma70/sigma32)